MYPPPAPTVYHPPTSYFTPTPYHTTTAAYVPVPYNQLDLLYSQVQMIDPTYPPYSSPPTYPISQPPQPIQQHTTVPPPQPTPQYMTVAPSKPTPPYTTANPAPSTRESTAKEKETLTTSQTSTPPTDRQTLVGVQSDQTTTQGAIDGSVQNSFQQTTTG